MVYQYAKFDCLFTFTYRRRSWNPAYHATRYFEQARQSQHWRVLYGFLVREVVRWADWGCLVDLSCTWRHRRQQRPWYTAIRMYSGERYTIQIQICTPRILFEENNTAIGVIWKSYARKSDYRREQLKRICLRKTINALFRFEPDSSLYYHIMLTYSPPCRGCM